MPKCRICKNKISYYTKKGICKDCLKKVKIYFFGVPMTEKEKSFHNYHGCACIKCGALIERVYVRSPICFDCQTKTRRQRALTLKEKERKIKRSYNNAQTKSKNRTF